MTLRERKASASVLCQVCIILKPSQACKLLWYALGCLNLQRHPSCFAAQARRYPSTQANEGWLCPHLRKRQVCLCLAVNGSVSLTDC